MEGFIAGLVAAAVLIVGISSGFDIFGKVAR